MSDAPKFTREELEKTRDRPWNSPLFGMTIEDVAAFALSLLDENERLRTAYYKDVDEVRQILGKALGYPWFKDDQKNFPGSTEGDGVCVGEHVPATLAEEAVEEIVRLRECVRVADQLRLAPLSKEAGDGYFAARAKVRP